MKLPFLSSLGAGRRGFSLVLITSKGVARADFPDPDAPPSGFWQTSERPGESISDALEAALDLHDVAPERVFILNDGLWAQTLSVSAAKIRGLSGDDLSAALRFEAESLSGIPALESDMALVPVGQSGPERLFWVLQTPKSELAQIADVLHQRDIRLGGVMHPGGLPRPLSPNAPARWHRIELWSQMVLAIAAKPVGGGSAAMGVPPVRVLSSPPESVTWHDEAEQWFRSVPADGMAELLTANAANIGGFDGEVFALSEGTAMRQLLAGWAHQIGLPGDLAVPMFHPPEPPLPLKRRVALAAVLVAAVATICGTHAWWTNKQIAQLTRELAKAQEPVKRLSELQRQNEGLFASLTNRRYQVVQTTELKGDLARALAQDRVRHATLLGALSSAAPPDLVIRGIDEQPGAIHVVGLALRPDIEGFATNLNGVLQEIGWKVEPPRRRALGLADGGGPWELQWNLRPMDAGTNDLQSGEAPKL